MSINRCDLCYITTVNTPCDGGNVTLDIELDPSTNMYMWVQDMHNTVYQYYNTTGIDGSFTFDPSYFPAGFFNPYSAPYDISFSLSSTEDTGESFDVGLVTYQCMILDFKDITLVYD